MMLLFTKVLAPILKKFMILDKFSIFTYFIQIYWLTKCWSPKYDTNYRCKFTGFNQYSIYLFEKCIFEAKIYLQNQSIIWHHDTQHNDNQHNDIQHKDVFVTHSITMLWHNAVFMLSVIMLNVVTLSAVAPIIRFFVILQSFIIKR
jgi:hypothetical protein